MKQRPTIDAAVEQFRHARGSLVGGLAKDAKTNRRMGRGFNRNTQGLLTPQQFVRRPQVTYADPNGAGVTGYGTNSAANVPSSGWDGESSASAPSITKVL